MKTYTVTKLVCVDCDHPISRQVFDYSTNHYRLPLCVPCQNTFKTKSQNSTWETLDLYVALKLRRVPAELEKWDGHKKIDIAVTDAKVNIEVDGAQHNFNPVKL